MGASLVAVVRTIDPRIYLRDRWALGALIVWLVSAVPSFVPVMSEDATFDWTDSYSDVPALLLVLVAVVLRIRTSHDRRAVRWWWIVAGAQLSWLGVRAIFFFIPFETWGIGTDLGSDLLYLVGYTLLALGLEFPPGSRRETLADSSGHRVESIGALTFAIGTLAFLLGSLMKIAQGSGTVAMIVGTSMMAAIIAPLQLGFHPVYLASSVGAGSLVCSWMNDSGFWIFAKMGGLTEIEALKSWTVMLVILGLVSFAVTVVLSLILPLA